VRFVRAAEQNRGRERLRGRGGSFVRARLRIPSPLWDGKRNCTGCTCSVRRDFARGMCARVMLILRESEIITRAIISPSPSLFYSHTRGCSSYLSTRVATRARSWAQLIGRRRRGGDLFRANGGNIWISFFHSRGAHRDSARRAFCIRAGRHPAEPAELFLRAVSTSRRIIRVRKIPDT